MFDVGGGELIVIVLAILLLFGPKKIPEIAQMISKGMSQVRKAQQQFSAQITELQRDLNSAANLDKIEVIKESTQSVPTNKKNYTANSPKREYEKDNE